MKDKIIIDIIKEFSDSNIKTLKIKYKKIDIELEKDDNTEENDILYTKDINKNNKLEDEKWILSPIVRKIL